MPSTQRQVRKKLTLPADMASQLETIAHERAISPADAVREALSLYITVYSHKRSNLRLGFAPLNQPLAAEVLGF